MRAQHTFGGMRDENLNEGGIRDDRAFNCVWRDRNISARTGFAHFDRQDAGLLYPQSSQDTIQGIDTLIQF